MRNVNEVPVGIVTSLGTNANSSSPCLPEAPTSTVFAGTCVLSSRLAVLSAVATWRDRLDALREDDRFVRVPARIEGAARPYRVDLDFSGLPAALGEEGSGIAR